MKLIFIAFLIAFVAANLLVKYMGAPGLLISSFTLIPFDFVLRCVIHERLRRSTLFLALFGVTVCAAAITVLVNKGAGEVALASVAGFTGAQVFAGLFYQWRKQHQDSYFIKVNRSDLIAIIVDSILFQLVAFSVISWTITGGQILIKLAGGLLWYYVIFKKLRLQNKIRVITEINLHEVSILEDGSYGIGFSTKKENL